MTSETKISLLIGLGMVLVIGIVISDQLAVPDPEANAPLLRFAEPSEPAGDVESLPAVRAESRVASASRSAPIPTPAEAELARQDDVLSPTPGVPAIRIDGARAAMPEPETEVVAAVTPEPQRPIDAATASVTRSQPIARSERVTPPQRVLRIETDGQRPAGRVHTVMSGDNLSAIAERYYGDRNAWRKIAVANRDSVGDNGLITPGMRLSIPDVESASVTPVGVSSARPQNRGATATVQSGDSLAKLAARHLGDSGRWDEIYELNRDVLSSPDRVLPGMELKLPDSESTRTMAAEPSQPAKAAKTHTIQSGDSLSSIAAATLGSASRWDEIYELNRDKLSSPDRLILDVELRLPER
ncbi:MAG: LysM peptidoglycan-binding domain-containing protein [Phycisphaeraceae bacterium]